MPQVNEACSRRKICVTITKLGPCTGEKKPKNHEKWPSRPFFKKTVSTIFCFAFFLETRPISELNDTTFIRVLGRNSFCRYLTHVYSSLRLEPWKTLEFIFLILPSLDLDASANMSGWTKTILKMSFKFFSIKTAIFALSAHRAALMYHHHHWISHGCFSGKRNFIMF